MSQLRRPSTRALSVLTHFEMNVRASYAQIGRNLGLSRESVQHIVTRLEEDRIISGYMTFINTARLGLTSYVVYAQIGKMNDIRTKACIQALIRRPEVYWISSMGGKYDILFGITAKHVLEFNKNFVEIQDLFGGHLSNISINTRMRTIQFPRSYLSDEAPSRRESVPRKILYLGYHVDSISLEARDRGILHALSVDTRATNQEIARTTRMSRITVEKRIKQLESSGVIQGYCANVNAEKLGYEIFRILIGLKDRSATTINKIYTAARACDAVTYFDHGIGAWDIEITCEVKNQLTLQRILRSFRNEFLDAIDFMDLLPVFEDNVKFKFTI